MSSTSEITEVASSSDLAFVKGVFAACYPFGSVDPVILDARLQIELKYRPKLCGCAEPGSPHEWFVVTVSAGNARAHRALGDALRASARPLPIAVEGPAGIGKTTMLGPYAGSDLTEIRQSPFGLLTGHGDEFSMARRVLRRIQSRGNIIDRSEWLASTVYASYARRVMFLFAEPLKTFLKLASPHRVVVVDNPKLSTLDLHNRIIARGGPDKHEPPCYTEVTRLFFSLAAKHYELERMTPASFQELYLSGPLGNLIAHCAECNVDANDSQRKGSL